MIEIAEIPYEKCYKFSYTSDAFILKVVLYSLALILPFFIVFSTNNFYLSFADNVSASPIFTYDYNYHITIETDVSLITPSKSIQISYENNQNKKIHTFGISWSKPVSQKVKKVSIATSMKYSTNTVTDAFGLVQAQASGPNIADVNFIGNLAVKSGQNSLNSPPTSSPLSSLSFSLSKTQIFLQQNYSHYLQTDINYLMSNMPTNILKINLRLKNQSTTFVEQNASILGQLIWSFKQYFPIACVFFFGAKWILGFLLRQGVLQRGVIHDKF